MKSFLLLVCIVVLLCSVSGEDPDISRNVTQMIEARGYPYEQHYVVTSDGFILSVQRITGPRLSKGAPTERKPVVLLQHGLEDNSITWVIQQVVNESLGFILADAGYDVWMNNVRGNVYSNANTQWSPSDAEFWAWSFDEMAHIDLPTVIDYILGETGQSNLSYIGHSQGTMMGFIGYGNQALASKVNLFVALAPVAWAAHTKSQLLLAMAMFEPEIDYLFQIFGVHDFTPDSKVLQFLLPRECGISPSACEYWVGLMMGFDTSDWNNTRLPVIMAHEPSGTSVQNVVHWSQLVHSGNFQAYDYGAAGNMKHYNSSTPPQYNPDLVTVPTALFYGGNDDLADVTDVKYLIPRLTNLVYQQYEASYCHTDFIWGVDANEKIYAPIVSLLKQYATNNSN